MSEMVENPFSVTSPEDLTAQDTLSLFVDVFTDFYKIREPGHSMLNGPRGSGKSMMFRYLLPDCQMLEQGSTFSELSSLAVLVPVKNTNPAVTELLRLLDSQANIVINEHMLTTYVASSIFSTLGRSIESVANRESLPDFAAFLESDFAELLGRAGGGAIEAPEPASAESAVLAMADACDQLYNQALSYLRQLSFSDEKEPYGGALCGYLDFLVPMVEALRRLPGFPSGPVYLLIDDGDYLNLMQTQILNSWIATRTSASVSIKVSTALNYKAFTTLFGHRIDSPHDYSEVNISDIYTSSRGKYLKRVEAIIKKRLKLSSIAASPHEFFPVDQEQEEAIEKIGKRIREEWEREGRGYRPSDDVLRYARPNFIASLGGRHKSGSSYSYAGFEQLVHVSSGVVRFFLNSAAIMFSEQLAEFDDSDGIEQIAPRIQDYVLRQESDALMFDEFEQMFREYIDAAGGGAHEGMENTKLRLQNLLNLLGHIFYLKLVSGDSERRVFSIAFSDRPSPEVRELLKLGVQLGYFQKSSIGNKDGTGRTPLYILTRRLAPHFKLDPTGFAGYLFVTNEKIEEGLRNPGRFLRKLKREKTVNVVFNEGQLRLFD